MSIITDDNINPKRVDINSKNPNTKAEKIDYDRRGKAAGKWKK